MANYKTTVHLTEEQKLSLKQALLEVFSMVKMKVAIEHYEANCNNQDQSEKWYYASLGHYAGDLEICFNRFMRVQNFDENYLFIVRRSGVEFYEKHHDRSVSYIKDNYQIEEIYEVDLEKLSKFGNFTLPNYQSLYDTSDDEYCCIYNMQGLGGTDLSQDGVKFDAKKPFKQIVTCPHCGLEQEIDTYSDSVYTCKVCHKQTPIMFNFNDNKR